MANFVVMLAVDMLTYVKYARCRYNYMPCGNFV